ncbi:hypothetical protein PsorP6_015721 [Peronosclerospora sorghi]|uniref:Uncharacterized protein n=1 Tax=Peronosclerospora sorghi TaxID=230839 RepID=A0ACC0WP85_9STRA|nr:hypothetical protein PsorP6_015721 [Peronosclerospora sorghi]
MVILLRLKYVVLADRWVLHSSAFTILRNEDKFRSRNKSKRTLIEAAIFRPEIVQYMKDARVQLYAVQGKAKLCLPSGEPVYTDEQAQGLGKNYTRETSRLAGIESYTFFIKLFALNALLNLVEGGQVSIDSTVASVDSSRYELATLAEEFDQKKNVHDCLDDLVLMMAKLAKMAADGKLRDEIRGQRIIPDYNDVHKPASEEPVILKAQRIADDVKHRVAALVARG